MNPKQEASTRVGAEYDVRVLEPSPPAVIEPPWFADDPTARGESINGKTIVSPVTTGDVTWDDLCRDEPSLGSWCADRWLGAWRPLPALPDLTALTNTRLAWHALAEHVVAPARYTANGKIGLRFTRNGFGTPFFARVDDGGAAATDEQVRVEGVNLLVTRGGKDRWLMLATVGAAAKLAGIEAGAPADLYTPTTALEPDAPLRLDARSTEFLGAWHGFAASVLEQLRAEAPVDAAPSRLQLWPEHFDLSVDLGDEVRGARGTFGASPGDAQHPAPYLYVTHWAEAPDDEFWNDPSFAGAGLGIDALTAHADGAGQRAAALDFYRQGRALLDGA